MDACVRPSVRSCACLLAGLVECTHPLMPCVTTNGSDPPVLLVAGIHSHPCPPHAPCARPLRKACKHRRSIFLRCSQGGLQRLWGQGQRVRGCPCLHLLRPDHISAPHGVHPASRCTVPVAAAHVFQSPPTLGRTLLNAHHTARDGPGGFGAALTAWEPGSGRWFRWGGGMSCLILGTCVAGMLGRAAGRVVAQQLVHACVGAYLLGAS